MRDPYELAKDILQMNNSKYTLETAVGMNDRLAKPIDTNLLMQVFEKHMKAKIVSSS